MLYLLILSISVLFFINLILWIFFQKVLNYKYLTGETVDISVIIAARNESKNIVELINSLSLIEYPKSNYEVVIVDDNSTDDTFRIIEKEITQSDNISVYKLDDDEKSGKRDALSLGISKANNPFILITDADCKPGKFWLQAFADKFSEGYDVLFGIAPFIQSKSFIAKISCFENLRTSILSIALASLKQPYTAAARSLGFFKSSFEKIGGYSHTADTLSGDDDLLIREAVRNKMKIGVVTAKDSFVYSRTRNSLGEYLDQRARHTQTASHYLPTRIFLLAFWHGLNLFFLLSTEKLR